MTDANKLKTKLEEWGHRYRGPDPHSISHQISSMLWRSAFYRSINESRKYLPKHGKDRNRANGPLHELIDEGYLMMTGISIRRILEDGAWSGPRSVVSLYGLIRDVAENVKLLTRANVLEARGLIYDFEPLKQRARKEAWALQRAGSNNGTFISRDGWADSEYWHGTMDKLCDVTAEKRHPSDVPDAKKFEILLQSLAASAKGVKVWADKFVAHASTFQSRETLDPQDRAMSLARLWALERVIVRGAAFISMYILDGSNFGGVPEPQFDQFEFLHEPFTADAARQPMENAWREHKKEIRECDDWFWDKPLVDPADIWTDE